MLTFLNFYYTQKKKELGVKVKFFDKIFSLKHNFPIKYKNYSVELFVIDTYSDIIKIYIADSSSINKIYTLKIKESTHLQSIRYILED